MIGIEFGENISITFQGTSDARISENQPPPVLPAMFVVHPLPYQTDLLQDCHVRPPTDLDDRSARLIFPRIARACNQYNFVASLIPFDYLFVGHSSDGF
jgi:hypothetical protein